MHDGTYDAAARRSSSESARINIRHNFKVAPKQRPGESSPIKVGVSLLLGAASRQRGKGPGSCGTSSGVSSRMEVFGAKTRHDQQGSLMRYLDL